MFFIWAGLNVETSQGLPFSGCLTVSQEMTLAIEDNRTLILQIQT